jgi:hypothetical protein
MSTAENEPSPAPKKVKAAKVAKKPTFAMKYDAWMRRHMGLTWALTVLLAAAAALSMMWAGQAPRVLYQGF